MTTETYDDREPADNGPAPPDYDAWDGPPVLDTYSDADGPLTPGPDIGDRPGANGSRPPGHGRRHGPASGGGSPPTPRPDRPVSSAATPAAPSDPPASSDPPAPVTRLLGQRPLIVGEEPATYDALMADVARAIAPADAVEWLWVKDGADLAGEIARLRRLRAGMFETEWRATVDGAVTAAVERDPRYAGDGHRDWCRREDLARRLFDGWRRGTARESRRVERLLARRKVSADGAMAAALWKIFERVAAVEDLIATAEARRDRILMEIEKRREIHARRRRRAEAETAGPGAVVALDAMP